MPVVNDILNQLRLRNIFNSPSRNDEGMGLPNTWTGEGQRGTPNPYVMSLGEKQDPFLPQGGMTQPVDVGPAKPINPQQDEAMKAFMLSLGEMPTREQGKPSNWRKLGAGIVGAGQGMDQGHKFLTRPYDEKIDDWKLKTATQGRAAELERLNNSQISRDEYNDMMIQWRNADLERKGIEGQQRIDIAEKNSETARMRAEVYQNLQNGGTIVRDQVTGKTYLQTRVGETKEIPVNTLTKEEEVNLETQGRLKVVAAQGANAIAAAAVPRQVNTTGSTTVTTTGGGNQDAILPSQEKVRQYTNAQEAYNSHPEWRPFITLRDPGANEFDIAPPSPGWFGTSIGAGPDVEEWKKLVAFIKGNNPAPTPGAAAPKVTTSERNTNTTSSKGGTPTAPVTIPKKGDKVGSAPVPPPPIEKRTEGMRWTLPNGKEVVWSVAAKGWVDAPGVK